MYVDSVVVLNAKLYANTAKLPFWSRSSTTTDDAFATPVSLRLGALTVAFAPLAVSAMFTAHCSSAVAPEAIFRRFLDCGTDATDDADAATDYGTAPYNHNNEAARFINLDIEPAHTSIMRPDKLEQH